MARRGHKCGSVILLKKGKLLWDPRMTPSPWASPRSIKENMTAHTEEFEAEEERIKQMMEEFTADIRHLRFVEDSDYNWTCINEFLESHNLDTTVDTLHFAYTSLVRDGLLELLPLGEYAEPQEPEPAPVQSPSAIPAPSVQRRGAVIWRNGRPLTDEGARRLI